MRTHRLVLKSVTFFLTFTHCSVLLPTLSFLSKMMYPVSKSFSWTSKEISAIWICKIFKKMGVDATTTIFTSASTWPPKWSHQKQYYLNLTKTILDTKNIADSPNLDTFSLMLPMAAKPVFFWFNINDQSLIETPWSSIFYQNKYNSLNAFLMDSLFSVKKGVFFFFN